MKVAAVDLFCGAGGLSYGLQQAGVSVVAGIDWDRDCNYPYEQNIDGEYVRADIRSLAQDPEPIAQMYPWDADLKVLAACAPCQPYSTMGHSKGKDHEDHQKWGLLNEVSRIVRYVEPDVVVTENVLQVKQEDGVYDAFIESLESQGYHINSDENKNVYCPEYGIPQKRKRWVVMASKRGLASFFPHNHTPGSHQGRRGMAMPQVDDVVEWSRTERGGRQYSVEALAEAEEPAPCKSIYSLCGT